MHYKSTNGKADSTFIADLLKETFSKYKLHNHKKDIHILSDGGSENKGKVLSWIKNIIAPPIVKKTTALTNEFPFSNSMSESTHRIYKTDFIKGETSVNIVAHLKSLELFFYYFNHVKLPCRLHGRTLMEVINGLPIDRYLFSEQEKIIEKIKLKKTRNYIITLLNSNVTLRLNFRKNS